MCAESKSAILKCYLSPLSLSLSSVPLQAALVHYCIIRKHILWEVYVCVCVKIDNGCNLSRSEA